jgi:lysine-specific demethylase 3
MYNVLPAKEYCSETGFFNVSNRLSDECMPPDMGPKMFISQGSDPEIKSRTKLHCDMADAVNVMCFAKNETAAAQWEIFPSKDLSKLRTFVHNLNKKRQRNFGFNPILSESSYLNEDDLIELEKETGVKPFRFHQKPGDAVFVPAGCAHQVQNIHGSIKCAYDFLSPETMRESPAISRASSLRINCSSSQPPSTLGNL